MFRQDFEVVHVKYFLDLLTFFWNTNTQHLQLLCMIATVDQKSR